MNDPLEIFAEEAPQKTALIAEGKSYSAFELNYLVEKKAQEIEKESLQTFLGHTNVETIVKIFAVLRAGATALPLNTRAPVTPTFTKKEGDILLFTSGSTGVPKLVALSKENFYYSALASIAACGLSFQDRWLLSLPLFHVGGLAILFRCFMAKATVVLDKEIPCTHISFVPTQLYRLLRDNKKLDAKCILLGGAPVAKEMLLKARTQGMNVFETYSLTEMSSQVTMEGKVLPYREVRLGEDGEIFVRGKTLALNIEGWYPTKDLGIWDAEGNLQIIGRKDNMFISGGENIQPEEIELALCRISGITQAVVVPISDPEFGKRPVAFIDGPCDLDKIRAILAETLPKYKLPIAAYPLPSSTGLKPNRKELEKTLA